MDLGAKHKGQMKIGSSTRGGDLKNELNPGPGTYEGSASRPFSAGPKYGFPKSMRNQKYSDMTPGRIYKMTQLENITIKLS